MASKIASKLGAELRKRTKKTDGKFFKAGKKGEELKGDLNSNDKDLQKNALKQIIADMTLGRDVSKFFTEVVKLSWTPNMEVKKLVYLYLMANAKLHPDKAILAVNTFVQDSQHTNPIVRALAVRTMLCIRVDNIADHVCPPLRNALKDKSEYVRKTAALGVLKLFHTHPALCEEQGFIRELEMLVTDSAPVVVANAVLALSEIMEHSGHDYPVTEGLVKRLFNCLSGCTEWGQVSVLDFISRYKNSPDIALLIVERCVPRLHQSHPAVLLSAVRVILRNLDALPEQQRRGYFPKLTPPIVTLMGKDPQTQYVTMRCMTLVMQKYTGLFSNPKDVKAFFCTDEDPVYVRLEKLNVLLQLLNDRNAQSILKELEEYCQDVDPIFKARSVQALASCAVRLEGCVPRVVEVIKSLCMNVQLVETVLLAVKDILRKYPSAFIDVLPPLLEEIDVEGMEDDEAKCALVWAVGEFGEQLPDAQEKLMHFVDTFTEQSNSVQLAVVTATVKFYLRSSSAHEGLLNNVLGKATAQDNADLRDRAYMYWRMLSKEEYASKLAGFVLNKKAPLRADGVEDVDVSKVNELVGKFSTVACVYHKVPASFLPDYGHKGRDKAAEEGYDDQDEYVEDEEASIVPGAEAPPPATAPEAAAPAAPAATPAAPAPTKPAANALDDIFGPGSAAPAAPAAAPKPSSGASFDDIFGGAPMATPAAPAHPQLLAAAQCDGLKLHGGFANPSGAELVLTMVITNSSAAPLSGFALQFNTNALGLKNERPLDLPAVPPGQTATHHVPLTSLPTHVAPGNAAVCEIALKTSLGRVYYFSLAAPAPQLVAGLGYPRAQ
eukprot:TRINITY_DN580_c0_g1_i1.p1 TRINITY_DN580_c0_g1~~TRINITY_DN580_c0_g1_i1.p1  ORF type:complete len:873 (+),score=349.16 TRINITY_DN580_c0_g1_i1:119-2620(+)